MSFINSISTFLPVQNTLETRIIDELFSDDERNTKTYYSELSTFKVEFFDYAEIESTGINLSFYIGETFFSSISKGEATLNTIETINGKTTVFLLYKNSNKFLINDTCSLLQSGILNNSVSFIIKKTFQIKPKQLFYSEIDYKELKKNRNQPQIYSQRITLYNAKSDSRYYLVNELNKFTNKSKFKLFQKAK